MAGKRLSADARYTFDFESMAFTEAEQGIATADHIKFLRLVFRVENPAQLQQVADAAKVLGLCSQLVGVMRREYIRI